MLSRKIIATHVTNLTDARYFAARGVDYLLFDLDEITLPTILEIKEWVEGPRILLLFSEKTIALVDECVIKVAPFGIGGTPPSISENLMHLTTYSELFTPGITHILLQEKAFKHIKHIKDLSELDDQDGIIISGKEEEEIGIKSFEQLDDLLDALEID